MTKENEDNTDRYPTSNIDDVARHVDHFSLGDDGDFVKEVHLEVESPLDELESIHSHLVEELENAKNRDGYLEDRTLLNQRERVLLLEFFTVCHAMIEEKSSQLLQRELLSEEHQFEDYSNQIFERYVNQSKRENLLWEIGLIDAGLKGDLKQVRTARNQLVHSSTERMSLSSIDEWNANSDRGLRAFKQLQDL